MAAMSEPAHGATPPRSHAVVVYSDDPAVRQSVMTAVGRRPASSLGRIEWEQIDTGRKLVARVDDGGVDLLILDGEAWPTGGLGLAKQLKDEIRDCPPTLVLVGRRADAWLATWSLADAVVPFPLDAPELIAATVEQLQRRDARLPVRRAVG